MKTEHSELEYGENATLPIGSAVAEMDVPFCDIGLEMGTWLLGNAAERRADLILTGDGGDELWASHPVYAAQRLLGWYEKLPIPQAIGEAFQRLAAALPDSDQKRDLRVKLKRILPPAELPRTLGPYRWRAYYTRPQLEAILTPEAAAEVRNRDPFKCVLDAYEGYDGPDDGLSKYIYNDYTTITPYYFPRLNLLRRFGIEVRCPFYDRSLVALGARIPAHLKLERLERTKRLFRIAMEGILPDVINHRKDKLGHSIPFKNWLRQDGPLAHSVAEVCSPSGIRARGLFRPEVVQQLLEEHRARRHNHSQRIWAIHVLELWMRSREART
jgi:asparagine synthase (glutamine-hydrolysing)